MNRALSVGLIAIGLLIGYLVRAPQVDAQTASFPYGRGDTVRIEYPDGLSRGSCVIERFYESFVSCSMPSRLFVTPDAPPTLVYNLGAAISVHLVKRAE
jgi:hypothetical protein